MRRAQAAAGEQNPGGYFARLTAEPRLLAELIGEVSVGETSFFRHAAQFDVLRTRVLPALRAPRVWSAGCSSGEEAYSLAILLDECGLLGRARICATDVSPQSLSRARRGEYGNWSLRGVAPAQRERALLRAGEGWSIAPRFRAIDFRLHNLLDGAPPGAPFDLILCRNVLLYFGPAALDRAARVLASALVPGGTLVTAPTDPPLPAGVGLEPELTAAGIVYRPLASGPAPWAAVS
jgi:chemotaxis protein methyltransferase CheR